MADYITTFTKVHIDPLKPEKDKIFIEDIAHSLSLQCRANGHFPRFFSVAQHCLDCAAEARARSLKKRVQLACLLHDAAEAYFADIPKPIKQHFPEYEMYELRLLDVIYEKYLGTKLTKNEQKIVSDIDHSMFCYEFLAVMGEQAEEQMPRISSKPTFKTRPAIEIEEEYKCCFRKLTAALNS